MGCLQALYDTTLDLLEDALRLWPGVNVRMHYVDKLLAANRANKLNPPPALLTGLHIMTRIQDTQVMALGCAPVACLHASRLAMALIMPGPNLCPIFRAHPGFRLRVSSIENGGAPGMDCIALCND